MNRMEYEKGFGRQEDEASDALNERKGKWWKPIAAFGYQNGVPEERVPFYTAEVFEKVSFEGVDFEPEEGENRLFQVAANLLASYRTGSDGSLLKFEEDKEIHEWIQKLDSTQRLALVLFYFHGKSAQEIAALINQEPEAVNNSLSQSIMTLTGQLALDNELMTIKRLELANKSYLRIPFEIPEEMEHEEELQARVADLPPPAQIKPATAPTKKSKVFLVSAGIFLAGVIGATFLMEDPNSNTASPVAEAEDSDIVTDAMIDAWKEEYEKARESSPERLGVNPDAFDNFDYVKAADQQKNWTFSENTINELRDDPKEMQREVDLLLLKIETPKEMLVKLPSLFLMSDELEPVIENYENKTTELIYEGDQILREYEKELSDLKVNGEISPEKLLMEQEHMPEKVEKLIDSLPERGLSTAKHPADTRFILRRNMEVLYPMDQLQSNFGVEMLRFDPYFDEDGLLVSVDEMSYALPMTEYLLLEQEVGSEEFQKYAHVFQHSFWLLLKGDANQQVFDDKGVVKEKYQRAWKEIALGMENPLVFLLLPIVEEMEASGWTESISYDRLQYEDVMNVLLLEKEGQLAEMMPNGDVTIEAEMVRAEDFFTEEIETLYSSFVIDYERNRLKGASPLEVLRLFQYANQRKDPVAMWHLMSEGKPSLEEYTKFWRQQPDISEQIRYVEIAEESMQRRGRNLSIYPFISYLEEEPMMMYNPELVTIEDHIWEVTGHLYERYDLPQENGAFKAEVEKLYAAFALDFDEAKISSASPGEIGGLFLLAAEKKNYEMLKALSIGTEEPPVDIIEAQLASRGVPAFSEATVIKFFNEPVHGDLKDFSGGSLWFRGPADGSEEIFPNQINMVKTPAGWRMTDLTTY